MTLRCFLGFLPHCSHGNSLLVSRNFFSFEILTVYPHVIFMRFQACFQLSTSVASIAFFNVIYIFVKIFLLYPKRMLVSKILTTNFTCQEGFKIFTLMWFFKVSVCLNLFLHRSHFSLGSSCFHPCLNPETQRLRVQTMNCN